MDNEQITDLEEALKLLWFFIPDIEPTPFSNKAKDKETNRRWHKACELYRKYCFQFPLNGETK